MIFKRRPSAFFKTDLDITLRQLEVDTTVVAGIATHVCVLITALDGAWEGFNSVILDDCCAAYKRELHDKAISIYKERIPRLTIMTLPQLLTALDLRETVS